VDPSAVQWDAYFEEMCVGLLKVSILLSIRAFIRLCSHTHLSTTLRGPNDMYGRPLQMRLDRRTRGVWSWFREDPSAVQWDAYFEEMCVCLLKDPTPLSRE
jgi:hypothetical protein